jgi:hypothetical protein
VDGPIEENAKDFGPGRTVESRVSSKAGLKSLGEGISSLGLGAGAGPGPLSHQPTGFSELKAAQNGRAQSSVSVGSGNHNTSSFVGPL